MIFSTYHFIFLFFPTVLSIYFLLLHYNQIVGAKWWLVFCSLYFYFYGTGAFFPFYVLSIIINYVIGNRLSTTYENGKSLNRKLWLFAGLLWNVSLLGYYKYTDFVIININFFSNQTIPFQHILLPIGISFFTFQLIAYLVDSYHGQTKDYSLLNYLLFITFFPQLIVGPIVHHTDVVPQYTNKSTYTFNYKNVLSGLTLFSIGCAKKILIADYLTTNAQLAFEHAKMLNMLESWVASLSYTFSYYFDLSGYADMAIGLGLFFNIKIPINFNSPYKARNFADYWRRWHITLSRFLGDYVFRNIYHKGDGSIKFYYAVFITFLVSGFWHGAGWTFVVWGILNGMFVMAAHFLKRNNISLPYFQARFLTFLGIVIARVIFVSNSFKDASYVLTTMFDPYKFSISQTFYIDKEQPLYLLACFFIVFLFPNSNQIKEKFISSIENRSGFMANFKYAVLTSFLLVFSLLSMHVVGDFLYFQF